ncbi:hypothetical protein [Occallatibacter riparius]|uniref:Uncharacterized protein n=1 Tax=Occallatibacter riparius TaxID=1002689 RepID=A0A9J7BSU0_9BACT|nr:hypothetical protein [Occallatibacter riparius]UWZ85679.1 hypothetical protein MOP44_06970 [Occallatibacter riparius]
MTHPQLARDLLGIFCAMQGAGTIAVDMNRTHAANPLWLHHARFHVVWQAATTVGLAIIELALLFGSGPITPLHFYLALALSALPAFGFFVALVTRGIYGGALSDPNGIRPLMIGRTLQIDLNLVAEIAVLIVLGAIVLLFRS